MIFVAWIDPKGEVFRFDRRDTHADWARKAGTTQQQLFRDGWIQIAGDSIRSHTPVEGAPLRAAQGLLQRRVWITLVYDGSSTTYELKAHVFHKRRRLVHRGG